jgi:WD40 repeat protein
VKVKSPGAVPVDGLRYDAFISYSRSDVAFAMKVQAALKAREHTAWLDVKYIPGGEDWADRIEREIARCKSFIFIVTERSLVSRACGEELRQAVELKKKIIPIRHGAEPDSDLPPALEKREWVFLRTAEEFDRGIARLVEALDVDLEWRDQLTDLAERALRWAAGGGEVLRGSDLRSAEHCLATQTSHAQQLTTQQTDYILASRRARGRAQRNRLAAVVVALVATTSAAVIAVIQREAARTETRRAQAALLAIQAPQTNDPQLASLQAVGAYELGHTVDTRSAVLGQFNAARRGLPLTGQYGQVLALAFTPKTDTIMSGSTGGTFASWNTQSQRRVALFRVGGTDPNGNQANSVVDVAVATRAPIAAVATDKIVVWNVSTRRPVGRPLNVTVAPAYQSHTIAVSPDGTELAYATSGYASDTIHLWSITKQLPIGMPIRLAGPAGVDALAFSPSGRTVAAAVEGPPTGLHFYDVADQRQVAVIPAGTDQMACLTFSPTGHEVATCDGSTIRLYDPASRREIGSPLTGHIGTVLDAAFSPDGKALASAGTDATIRLWDGTRQVQTAVLAAGNSTGQSSVAFSPDGTTLASGSASGAIQLWTVVPREVGRPLTGQQGKIAAISFSPDQQTIASGSWNGTVRLWTVKTHQLLTELTGDSQAVSGVAFAPNGGVLGAAGASGLRFWRFPGLRPLHNQIPSDPLGGLAFVRQGADYVTAPDGGEAGGFVYVTNLLTLRRVLTMSSSDQTDFGVNDLVTSPNGRLVAIASDDGIRLWSIGAGHQVGRVFGGQNIQAVAFSRDGRLLASGGNDDTVRLWNVADRKELGTAMRGGSGAVNAVAFTPDGKTIVSGDDDGSVQMWDVATYREEGPPLTAHSSSVTSVAVSPDGKLVAAGYLDGTVRLWSNYDMTTYLRALCAAVDPRRAARLWKANEASIPQPRCPPGG